MHETMLLSKICLEGHLQHDPACSKLDYLGTQVLHDGLSAKAVAHPGLEILTSRLVHGGDHPDARQMCEMFGVCARLLSVARARLAAPWSSRGPQWSAAWPAAARAPPAATLPRRSEA